MIGIPLWIKLILGTGFLFAIALFIRAFRKTAEARGRDEERSKALARTVANVEKAHEVERKANTVPAEVKRERIIGMWGKRG